MRGLLSNTWQSREMHQRDPSQREGRKRGCGGDHVGCELGTNCSTMTSKKGSGSDEELHPFNAEDGEQRPPFPGLCPCRSWRQRLPAVKRLCFPRPPSAVASCFETIETRSESPGRSRSVFAFQYPVYPSYVSGSVPSARLGLPVICRQASACCFGNTYHHPIKLLSGRLLPLL